MQKGGRIAFHNDMLKRLAKKPWIAEHSAYVLIGGPSTELINLSVIPDFAPTCRRLTPGPGYLEADN